MAITMSGATVGEGITAEETFRSSNISDPGMAAGAGNIGGANLAGITPEFVTAYSSALSAYLKDVQDSVNLLTTVEVNVAFKGKGIESALNNFVVSIKTVANNYTTSLTNVQKKMITGVARVYESQDSDLSSNLKSDGGTLEDEAPNIS